MCVVECDVMSGGCVVLGVVWHMDGWVGCVVWCAGGVCEVEWCAIDNSRKLVRKLTYLCEKRTTLERKKSISYLRKQNNNI